MLDEGQLAHFTGTQHFYRNFQGLLYTDGIQYLAEQAGSYWLIDLVGSHQPKLLDARFQLWNLKVREDRSALIAMIEDLGQPIRASQEISYTDFPLNEFSFYCIDGGGARVMMLKSEY